MDIITIEHHPEYEVRILAPSAALEPRVASYPFYYCWYTTDAVDQWLNENVKGGIHVRDVKRETIEQGGAKVSLYEGVDFIFTDPKEAMLFKLTWA